MKLSLKSHHLKRYKNMALLFLKYGNSDLAREFEHEDDAKTVFIARFIFLFPPVVVNLLAGMANMPWRTFLFYNLTGSAAYTTTYILIGYLFGKKWKQLEAWPGPTALHLIFEAIILMVLGVIFRHSLSTLSARHFSKTRQRKHK